MLANRLSIGVMGDYPLIVNGAKFQETKSLRTLYVAGTGYNLKGSGNAIVVPVNSDIYSIDDLKGKSVSTPVGSAAWGMLLKAMQDANIPTSAYQLKNQAPAVGAANIATGRIDAHADFCPWSEIMEFRGTGRKIYDGSETGIPYLHGVVVREDFAKQHPRDRRRLHRGDLRSRRMDQGRSDARRRTDGEVERRREGSALPLLLTRRLSHTRSDHQAGLDRRAEIRSPGPGQGKRDRRRSISTTGSPTCFVRTAYKNLGLDYEAERAKVVDPVKANAGLPMEVWHARDGIKTFATMAEFLKAVADFNATGVRLNATYVYDKETGLKLFGKTAFYVKAANGEFSTFMRKREAEAYARHGRRHPGHLRTGLELLLLVTIATPDPRRRRGSGALLPEADENAGNGMMTNSTLALANKIDDEPACPLPPSAAAAPMQSPKPGSQRAPAPKADEPAHAPGARRRRRSIGPA